MKNTSLQEKLAGIRPLIPMTKRAIREPIASAMNWVGDGVDHVNIWERAETDLGRALSMDSAIGLEHHIFGRFSTMEGFWHYIRSEERDDRLRSMSGANLKAFKNKLSPVRITNFKAVIMDSMYQRICQCGPLLQEFKNSVLPFDLYWVANATGLRCRPAYFGWFIAGLEEIREAFKADRVPRFRFLMDRPNTRIYQFAAPFYEEPATTEDAIGDTPAGKKRRARPNRKKSRDRAITFTAADRADIHP